MNRNAYIAELTQLLYYMTPWDREAAVAKYKRMLDETEDLDALIQEIGKPMKLAVTLSRTYEATPEPDPNGAREPAETESEAVAEPTVSEEAPEQPAASEEEDAAPAPETPGEVGEAPQPEETQETEPEPEPGPESEAPDTVEAPPEEAAGPEAEDEPTAGEPEKETPAPETQDVPEEPEGEEEPDEPTDASEPVPAPEQAEKQPAQEEIFSEIFTAATKAQSAIFASVVQEEKPAARKPRLAFLIPYIILSVLIDIPVSIILFAVDIVIFGIAVVALAFGVYILQFLGAAQFAGIGDKLVIVGVSILSFTAALAVVALGVWFLRNAAIGFTEFLIRFGRDHGYQKEETP